MKATEIPAPIRDAIRRAPEVPPDARPLLSWAPSAIRIRSWWLSRLVSLPDTYQLPPDRPYAHPDRQIDHRNQEAQAPPLGLAHVTGIEKDRRRTGAIVRHGG